MHAPAGQYSERTPGQGIVDCVGNQRALQAVANFNGDDVPMPELLEWPADLLIDEMAVPLKFHDARHPTHTLGDPTERTKADEDL